MSLQGLLVRCYTYQGQRDRSKSCWTHWLWILSTWKLRCEWCLFEVVLYLVEARDLLAEVQEATTDTGKSQQQQLEQEEQKKEQGRQHQ